MAIRYDGEAATGQGINSKGQSVIRSPAEERRQCTYCYQNYSELRPDCHELIRNNTYDK